MKLSEYQVESLAQIKAFLNTDNQIFILTGYAGTGKTTILKQLINDLTSEKRQVRLMAPTGRASMILTQKSNCPAYTIHKSIYNFEKLYENEEENDFKVFYKLNTNQDNQNTVYIIDEASMISNQESDDDFFRFGSGVLLQDLFKYVFNQEGSRKIIFVGDDAQLPPIGMKSSPALDADHLSSKYNYGIQKSTLTEVFRQDKESGILKNATSIRDSISSNDFSSFKLDYSYTDVFKISSGNVVLSYKLAVEENHFEKAIILSHSNKQALTYNKEIRADLFLAKGNEAPKNGERLLLTKNNYNGEIELFNGMFADVIEVGDIVRSEKIRFYKQGRSVEEVVLNFREISMEVNALVESQLKTINIKKLLLNDFLYSDEGRISPDVQRALYIDAKNRAAAKNIKPKSELFAEFLRTDEYFNCLQAKFGYAITGHKSQGGEWENVIVDFKGYMGKRNSSFLRWSYTAITRSSEKLFCVDAPDYNALSNIILYPIKKIKKSLKGAVDFPHSDEHEFPFIPWLESNLKSLGELNDIEINFDDSVSHDLNISFTKGEQSCNIRQRYGKEFFRSSELLISKSENFTSLCFSILNKAKTSILTKRSYEKQFKNDLFDFILETVREVGVSVSNISEDQYCHKYFFNTDQECSGIEFYFRDRDYFTKAIPFSTNPNEDLLLKDLIKIIDK